MKLMPWRLAFHSSIVGRRVMAKNGLIGLLVALLPFAFLAVSARQVPQASTIYRFSDKSPYRYTAAQARAPEGCTAVHVNMLLRHGSRYPSSSHSRKIEEVVRAINRFSSTFRYKKLKLPWEMPLDFQQAGHKELARTGEKEMYDIAKRFVAKFPDVLGHRYSNANYSFVSTDTLRTSQSAVAFAQGLFEGKGHIGTKEAFQPVAVKFSGPQDGDRILRFYDVCPRYKKLVKESLAKQYNRFLKGPEMSAVARNIERRLNLTGKMKLSDRSVVELFLMCAFETQTSGVEGQWCSVFDRQDLEVLEYLFDLKIFWTRGYGQEINYKMSCHLFMDMTQTMERFMKERRPFGLFRFAHTGTVVPLLAMLGLFNDSEPLLAENFHSQGQRKFRVADIVPMSGNVAFVLYYCDVVKKVPAQTRCPEKKPGKSAHPSSRCQPVKAVRSYKVQVLVNESPVAIPACGGKAECEFSEFKNSYAHIISRCNFSAICRKHRRPGNRKWPLDVYRVCGDLFQLDA